MTDAGIRACMAMIMVTVLYAVYMVTTLLAGEHVPDGVLLTGVVAVVAGLGGYATAVAKAASKAKVP